MWLRYRFLAFWLRSKCSICSYQLNIWYEVHRTSSILNLFLTGDEVSVACYGFVTCRPCIAVPQGFWHTSPIILTLFILYNGKAFITVAENGPDRKPVLWWNFLTLYLCLICPNALQIYNFWETLLSRAEPSFRIYVSPKFSNLQVLNC